MGDVAITGIGMVTPLGNSPGDVLRAIRAGRSAAISPSGWAPGSFACPLYAPISDFEPAPFVPEQKSIRLMSRDALLAVAAGQLALRDAKIEIGKNYAPEDVGLFGATGLAGIALSEVSKLIQASADEQGRLDLRRFGATALKQVRPVLSFKILSNMPLCFLSIVAGIQGVNAIYNPWEGQGAAAIAAAAAAIRRGDAACALAGGTDVKTHELGFIALSQHGVFRSWQGTGSGCIPAEGAAFVLLEDCDRARQRNARIYAILRQHSSASINDDADPSDAYGAVLQRLHHPSAAVLAGDGDPRIADAEDELLSNLWPDLNRELCPKPFVGNLFAAAAALQVALAAAWAHELPPGSTVLANCFGYGSEQSAFLLEGA